jgi:hypothetical protein
MVIRGLILESEKPGFIYVPGLFRLAADVIALRLLTLLDERQGHVIGHAHSLRRPCPLFSPVECWALASEKAVEPSIGDDV